MSTPPDVPRWPGRLGLVALIAFAIVIPLIALGAIVFTAPWFSTPTPRRTNSPRRRRQRRPHR